MSTEATIEVAEDHKSCTSFVSMIHAGNALFVQFTSNESLGPFDEVPTAVWLFGSALAGLGWFRRKTA
jgi:hypothetical protein